jgi:hypothetical protein
MLVNSGFHTKISPKIIRNLVTRTQKVSPALSFAEKIKEYKGRKIITLPGAPKCLWPALGVPDYPEC